ncbi:MAG: cysteine synthase A [Bdellovibrionaceae bacterium]|nr:cysteine synthase A [Pseudobdellovibrionaceae bacterium]
MVVGSVWDAVGNTPLIAIESLSRLSGCEIYGKAEFLNPGGSVKDRAAKGIIAKAEQEGRLKPGGTIVEGTAGNTGIGIATLAAGRGYKTIISMPDNQAQEKYDLLCALGADVRTVPAVPFSNPNHFFHAAKRIAEETPGAFWANQFENTSNGDMHYSSTGPEIWAQTGGRIDTFVAAVGSSGTMSGVSRFLKERQPTVRTVVADPFGSGIFCHVRDGKLETQGSSVTEGIGIMRLTANYLAAKIDDAIRVNDEQMLDMLYYLAKYEGLVVGTSAALNVYAAFSLALRQKGSGKIFVTMLCDHGSRYASRVFNPSWLESRGLKPQPERIRELAG